MKAVLFIPTTVRWSGREPLECDVPSSVRLLRTPEAVAEVEERGVFSGEEVLLARVFCYSPENATEMGFRRLACRLAERSELPFPESERDELGLFDEFRAPSVFAIELELDDQDRVRPPNRVTDNFRLWNEVHLWWEAILDFFLALLYLQNPPRSEFAYWSTVRGWKSLSVGLDQLFPFPVSIVANIHAHCFPVKFGEEIREAMRADLDVLVDCWKHPLWPLRRFLTVMKREDLSYDSVLDLIFSFEGLFDDRTSKDYKILGSALILEMNRSGATRHRELLNASYRLRNRFVHGAETRSQAEQIDVGTESVSVDVLLDRLRSEVLAPLLKQALCVMGTREGQTTLRLSNEKVFEHAFQRKARS